MELEAETWRGLKARLTLINALTGRQAIIAIIMIGKILIVLPDMYIINIFIGKLLIGCNAMSHARFFIRWCVCSLLPLCSI